MNRLWLPFLQENQIRDTDKGSIVHYRKGPVNGPDGQNTDQPKSEKRQTRISPDQKSPSYITLYYEYLPATETIQKPKLATPRKKAGKYRNWRELNVILAALNKECF